MKRKEIYCRENDNGKIEHTTIYEIIESVNII